MNWLETIIGFNSWANSWKDWHMGLKGRPDCEQCFGRGIIYVTDGDDVSPDTCSCKKHCGSRN